MEEHAARMQRLHGKKRAQRAATAAVNGLLRCNEDIAAAIEDRRSSDRLETEAFTEFVTCRLAHEARLRSSLVARYLSARENDLVRSQKVTQQELASYRDLRFQRFAEYEREWRERPDSMEEVADWLHDAATRVYGGRCAERHTHSNFITLVVLSVKKTKAELSELVRMPGLASFLNRRLSSDWKNFVRRLRFGERKKRLKGI